MNDTWTIATVIAAIMLALNLGQRVFGGGWNLSKNLQGVEQRLQAAITASKKEVEDKQDQHSRETGETIAALKEHVRQIEFHLRDYYIRKDDFGVHMKSHDDLLRTNFENISLRLTRIEKTLDEKPKP
jgi:hypothetical protein